MRILRGEIVTEVADENRRAGATADAKAWVDALGKAPEQG